MKKNLYSNLVNKQYEKGFIHMSAWAIILYLVQMDLQLIPNHLDLFLELEMAEISPNLIDQLRSIADQKIETIQKQVIDHPGVTQDQVLEKVKQTKSYTDNLLQQKGQQYRAAQQILLTELDTLNYYESLVTPPIGCFSIYVQPAISITDFGGGAKDPIRSDVIYESKDAVGFAESQFSLDGKPLETKNGVALFERVFQKPGIYPLKASISARKMHSDSLCTWEKTFYLKVQE
ncbi:MAG: hypothetical protein WCR52_22295 [Bacteroidota bacterium]